MDRKAEEEPIAELLATTTTPRGPARLPIPLHGGRAAGWGFAGHALVVIPISGASRPESILDSAQAPELALSRDELAGLDAD